LLLHHELEQEGGRLLVGVGDDDMEPLLQLLDEAEIPFEEGGAVLALAEQGTMEDEVPADLLRGLPRDRRGNLEGGRLGQPQGHRASTGAAASGARAFSRLSTSWISSRRIPT